MKKFITNKKVLYLLGIVLLLVLWQVIAWSVGQEELIFPGPYKTLLETINLLKSSYTFVCILNSLKRMMIGFLISLLLAIVIGSFAGNSKILSILLSPTITSIKAIPTACLVFLFIILSGAKNAPIYIVTIVSFPILYEGVKGGINNIDKSIIEASELDGDNYFGIIRDIKLPLALPYIFVSIASSLSLSFKIEIMSEVITGSTNTGLGSAIVTSQRLDPTNLVTIFAYGLLAIVISLILDSLLQVLKKKYDN